jgi:hypothetical protein
LNSSRQAAVACCGKAAHQQRLEVLVQRVLTYEPTGQIGRIGSGADSQTRQRSFAQDCLGAGLKVPAFGSEPNLE